MSNEYEDAWNDGEGKDGGASPPIYTPLVDAVKKATTAAEGSHQDQSNAEGPDDVDPYVKAYKDLERAESAQ